MLDGSWYNEEFWKQSVIGCLGNLVSDLIVAALLLLVIDKWIRERPKLEVTAKFYKQKYGFSVAFIIKNTGNFKFASEDIYWTIYMPRDFPGVITPIGRNDRTTFEQRFILMQGRRLLQFHGLMKAPVFPGHGIIVLRIRVRRVESIGYNLYQYLNEMYKGGAHPVAEIYYKLNTSKDDFPRGIKQMQLETFGRVTPEYRGRGWQSLKVTE